MSVLVPGDAVIAEGQQHERGAEHNDTERQPGPKSLFVGSSKPQRVTGGTRYDGLGGEPGCERVHRLDHAGSSLWGRCRPPLRLAASELQRAATVKPQAIPHKPAPDNSARRTRSDEKYSVAN